MSTLTELLERVEKAEGPDRELDTDIVRQFGTVRVGTWWWLGETQAFSRTDLPPLTASVDAALALVERVLPRAEWCLEKADGGNRCLIWWDIGEEGIGADGKTPALAVCAALLIVLAEREKAS